jgi:AAA+ ATPase superfamily predicted ATPase
MTAFVGRDLELTKLKELARLDVASLVVIKGRRRVSKSRLASNQTGQSKCRIVTI